MKKYLAILIMFAGAGMNTLFAQHEMSNKEKMQIFDFWIGRWQGDGSMRMGPGEPKKSSVDEHIQAKLDGMVLLIEGIGKTTDAVTNQETVVHHALAVLSYDQRSNQYKFRSYLNDGSSTDAWLISLGENKFQWGFDIPSGGKTRYSITLDPVQKTWNEIGEYSQDGNTWMKFFEMNLKKVE